MIVALLIALCLIMFWQYQKNMAATLCGYWLAPPEFCEAGGLDYMFLHISAPEISLVGRHLDCAVVVGIDGSMNIHDCSITHISFCDSGLVQVCWKDETNPGPLPRVLRVAFINDLGDPPMISLTGAADKEIYAVLEKSTQAM